MERCSGPPNGALPEGEPSFAAFGFEGDAEQGWRRRVAGTAIDFRLLQRLDDLRHAELLQEEVFGVSARDLIPANELIVVPETGGAVIGAFTADTPEHAIGVLVGWGGFVVRPRIVSDFLAVRREARNLGLAAELKRLQAAIALPRGFVEIVWTVDPLRAANARLNFGKLGANGVGYEIDRYGAKFASGLYGGMPSDRLHVRWDIADARVISQLRSDMRTPPISPPEHARVFTPGSTERFALVPIPADIDALLATDRDAALAWRFKVREQLMGALQEGYVVVGFAPATAAREPSLLLERRE